MLNKVINVSVVQKTNGIVSTYSPITLKNVPTLASMNGAVKLTQLTDVDSVAAANGDTLVFHSDTNKYVVEKLDIENTTGTIDGGTF